MLHSCELQVLHCVDSGYRETGGLWDNWLIAKTISLPLECDSEWWLEHFLWELQGVTFVVSMSWC